METAILKKKRMKVYLKEITKMKSTINKLPINTVMPGFSYKNNKGEIIIPKTIVFL